MTSFKDNRIEKTLELHDLVNDFFGDVHVSVRMEILTNIWIDNAAATLFLLHDEEISEKFLNKLLIGVKKRTMDALHEIVASQHWHFA